MSARDALTKLITRTLSGIVTVTLLPSRALMFSVFPSTFSIVPRMRTGGAFCAQTAVEAVITAIPSAPAAKRAKLCRMMSSRFDRSVLAGRVSTSHLNTVDELLFRRKQPSTPVRGRSDETFLRGCRCHAVARDLIMSDQTTIRPAVAAHGS